MELEKWFIVKIISLNNLDQYVFVRMQTILHILARYMCQCTGQMHIMIDTKIVFPAIK